MKQTIKLFILLTVLVSACTKEKDPISKIFYIKDDIIKNTTWSANNVYIIQNEIDINSNATLTIEAGVTVKFENGSGITVAYNGGFGAIKANGTASKPILFTSNASVKNAGDWDAVWLYNGAGGSSFNYCTFEYGGGYSANYGMIYMTSAQASFENCNFRHSESFGIALDDASSFTIFENNNFSNTAKSPIQIYGKYVYTIGADNTYDPNTAILVKADRIDLPGVFVWQKQSVAYNFDGSFDIGSGAGTTINIEPGTQIKMGSNAELLVAYSGGYGVLNASGTAAEPVVITSASPFPSAGDWYGIFLYDGTSNGTSFNYCNISNGGGYSYGGNISLIDNVGANVTISNSTISNSDKYGIYKDNAAHNNPSITNVTYTSNALGDTNF